MSRSLHFVLTKGDETAVEAGQSAIEYVQDPSPKYDAVDAIAAFRPDGTVVGLDGEAVADYEGESLEELMVSMRAEIKAHLERPLPKVNKSLNRWKLRTAGEMLILRASALQTIASCKTPERFDPFLHEFNSFAWGEFGVTHLGNTNWIHESPNVWLVVLQFHN